MSSRKCSECGQVHLAGANGAIYCCGSLLRAVQMSGVFKDSKYFVDMNCRYSPERILADFQLFSSSKRNETSMKHLSNFVENHFDQPGSEMEYWSPPDWRSEPAFLCNIKDPQLKRFGSVLNRIWKQLGRTIKNCVRTSPLLYSLVYVPNPLIVPGPNFNEFYYWDTYWIVRGLLYSGMAQTARGMIDNLLYLVHQYKSVPQGGRIYYWGRSHPPMLVAMVKSYVEITGDEKYAVRALPLLEVEMDNFLKNHAVQVEGRTMYQYRDKSTGPRPEAYRDDVASASSFCTDEEQSEHFAHLKAACESGQDFSSRWYVSPCGNNVGTMANIKTTWIVPVDLNCILFRNCKTLAEFNVLADNPTKSQHYRQTACGLIKAITAVLWNEERGVWLDFDVKNRIQRDYFVVTNLSPLWLHAYPIADTEKISKSVLAYIEENNLDNFPGGVPHTLNNTGQKWDYPNVWPPMMYMLIEGLNNLGTPEATNMAQQWRTRWLRTNYEAYSQTGVMYEKYNCEVFGDASGGAESQNQSGYGWTNAVLIEMLARYGNELTLSDASADNCDCDCPQVDVRSALEDCPITSEAYLEKIADGLNVDYEQQIDLCSQAYSKNAYADFSVTTSVTEYSVPPSEKCEEIPQSVDKAAQASDGEWGMTGSAQLSTLKNDNASQVCSVCCRHCGRMEESQPLPEAGPISIDMDEINCLLDLSPSDAEDMRATCPNDDSATQSIKTATEDEGQDEGDAVDEVDDNESCKCDEIEESLSCTAPPPAPIMLTKVFPLADDIKCPLPTEPEPESTDGCTCDNKKANQSAAECD
ncbi:trehalase [Drosophila grimshawi]|uniref:Trehalase n=1 Tax=Drosophila grimshawi TaxID=7222 RepID=B4J7F8_DROGR|nr:trehalase [Drosophila grimshawi]EDW01082.1 GH21235 [Drosophila grimshawi]